jgi:hypothetical protein
MSDPTHPAGEPTSAPASTPAEPVISAPPAPPAPAATSAAMTTAPASPAPSIPAQATPAPATQAPDAPAPASPAPAAPALASQPPATPAPGPAPASLAPATLAAPVSVPPAVVVKRSKSSPVLAVLLILALLAGATAGTLYVLNKRASDKTIADQKTQIEQANATAKKNADDLKKAQDDLTKTRSDLDAAKNENTKNAVCVQAGKDLTAAALKQDNEGTTRALGRIFTACGGIPSPN